MLCIFRSVLISFVSEYLFNLWKPLLKLYIQICIGLLTMTCFGINYINNCSFSAIFLCNCSNWFALKQQLHKAKQLLFVCKTETADKLKGCGFYILHFRIKQSVNIKIHGRYQILKKELTRMIIEGS